MTEEENYGAGQSRACWEDGVPRSSEGKAFALEDGGGEPGQMMDHPRRSMYIHELGHLRLGWSSAMIPLACGETFRFKVKIFTLNLNIDHNTRIIVTTIVPVPFLLLQPFSSPSIAVPVCTIHAYIIINTRSTQAPSTPYTLPNKPKNKHPAPQVNNQI